MLKHVSIDDLYPFYSLDSNSWYRGQEAFDFSEEFINEYSKVTIRLFEMLDEIKEKINK